MSNLISENKISNVENSKIEILIDESHPYISNQTNPIIPETLKNYSSQRHYVCPLNKNGLSEKDNRKQINIFESGIKNTFFLKNIDYNYYISMLNDSKNNFSRKEDYGNTNLLESNQKIYEILGNFSKETDFQTHLYKRKRNTKLINEVSLKFPLISRVFQRTNYIINNNVNKKEIFLEKEKNRKYISKSSEPILLRANAGIKAEVKNKSKSINKDNNLKKVKKNNLNKKIDFKNKDNFLLNYDIKEIIVKNILGLTYEIPPQINLKDMENFINNLCNKTKNKINSKNFFNNSMVEYIEYNKINGYEEKDKNFLQKKRKNSFHFEEINDINTKNKSKNKKHPLKKRHKKMSSKIKNINKNNNKKDGKTICTYLNKIEINKNSLENFPFYPSIRNKEITKIEFLKGIAIKKYSIRINKKAQLVKDQRNLEYINNKKYQIIYEKKESNEQIILNINGFHILYLIIYYYYQMQKCIKQINKYHYSHANFNKTKNELKKVEEVIKKCNRIVHDITK